MQVTKCHKNQSMIAIAAATRSVENEKGKVLSIWCGGGNNRQPAGSSNLSTILVESLGNQLCPFQYSYIMIMSTIPWY